MVTGVPPAIDGSDATHRALSVIYPGDRDSDRVDLGHLADVVAQHQYAKEAEKLAKEQARLAANRIQAALGDHTEGEIDGQLAVSWRPQSRSDLDRERLRTEQPEIFMAYRTSSTYRVLRHHAPKKEKT